MTQYMNIIHSLQAMYTGIQKERPSSRNTKPVWKGWQICGRSSARQRLFVRGCARQSIFLRAKRFLSTSRARRTEINCVRAQLEYILLLKKY